MSTSRNNQTITELDISQSTNDSSNSQKIGFEHDGANVNLSDQSANTELELAKQKINASQKNDSSSNSTDVLSYFKSLLTFKGDVFSLSSPAFLLSGTSLLEFRWLISSFKGSYIPETDGDKSIGVKKPYNPILGEQFLAKWQSEEFGETKLVCEQVSHHPPITAVFISNEKMGIYCNGSSALNKQKVRFAGTSVKVDQFGHMTVIFKKSSEFYIMSLPNLVVGGLFTGSLFMEAHGKLAIVSNKNSLAVMNFHKKPWLYGSYNKFDCEIYSKSSSKDNYKFEDLFKSVLSKRSYNGTEPDYAIKGIWDSLSTFEPIKKHLEEISANGSEYLEVIDTKSGRKDKSKKLSKKLSASNLFGRLNIGSKSASKSELNSLDINTPTDDASDSSVSAITGNSDVSLSEQNSETSSPGSMATSSMFSEGSNVFIDIESMKKSEIQVLDVKDQNELESHRVWNEVTVALHNKDYHSASEAKNKIEEYQRALARMREEKNEKYKPHYFKYKDFKDFKDKSYIDSYNLIRNEFEPIGDGLWFYSDLVDEFF
ncbi:Protein kes1 [Smittium culicis]|uniref:Protein kes1 n=1 Tax=Smittium culicis TaxID=133412 RepID=A0A1R1YDZ1_9FUNG|nr:Protein kes1 [Smittium culicis]